MGRIVKKILLFPFVFISAIGIDCLCWNLITGLAGPEHHKTFKQCWDENWKVWKEIK